MTRADGGQVGEEFRALQPPRLQMHACIAVLGRPLVHGEHGERGPVPPADAVQAAFRPT